MFKFNPWKSLTFWGGLGAASTLLVTHFDPSALSPQATGIGYAISVLLGTIGARNAIAKNASEVINAMLSKQQR